jgi:hypothetical protein
LTGKIYQQRIENGRRASFTGTKCGGGGKKLESESEGGQKFLPPNPLPFCPPERLDFKIRNSDFRQKKFEHQSKNTEFKNKNMSKPKFQTLVILFATVAFCGLILLLFPSLRNMGLNKYIFYGFVIALGWQILKSFIFMFKFDD